MKRNLLYIRHQFMM